MTVKCSTRLTTLMALPAALGLAVAAPALADPTPRTSRRTP